MLKIVLNNSARRSFINDLKSNGVNHTFIKGFTTIEVEDSAKARMAIQMVKERFGSRSIVVSELLNKTN